MGHLDGIERVDVVSRLVNRLLMHSHQQVHLLTQRVHHFTRTCCYTQLVRCYIQVVCCYINHNWNYKVTNAYDLIQTYADPI